MKRFAEDDRILILGINATRGAGLREVSRILERLGRLGALCTPAGQRFIAKGPFPARLKRELAACDLMESGRAELDRTREDEVSVVLAGDDEYPERLSQLANPPLAIFFRGTLPPVEARSVAIVGSRACSRYGERIARALGESLGEAGIVVVSGLARGVDRAAHEGALASGGKTLAALGCGLPRIYPPEHKGLATEVAASGACLTEFGPNVPPLAPHFPRRNRLIAALSDAVVLVEAKEKSGGLITVRWAVDLGREVFCLPGQVDNPLAAGGLALIRDGATLIRGAEDLISDMGWNDCVTQDASAAKPDDTRVVLGVSEQRLLGVLDHEPVSVDALIGVVGQSPGEVLTALMSLEVRGLVEQLPGMIFRRAD